ncbi:MAG: hypothetical protein NTW49_08225 [Bacteroidia bacterium]|nr:hypothetical protein [Bacteroidia bacterium]
MKTIFIFLLLSIQFFNSITYAQQNKEIAPSACLLRNFIETPGILQIKSNILLGTIKGENKIGMEFWAVEYHNSDSNSISLKGIKIRITDSKEGVEHKLSAYLDADEVVEYTAYFNTILNFSEQWKNEKTPMKEVSFLTRDHIKFNFSQEGKKQSAYIEIRSDNDFMSCDFSSVKADISRIHDYFGKAYLELNLKAFDKSRNELEKK